MDKQYLKDRCYVRGLTPLGIFNTIASVLCNRVLVLHKDSATGRLIGWHIGKGTDFPKPE